MSNTRPTKDTQFSDLGLSPKILSRLTQLGFITPTPIQAKAIPFAVAGQDVIGIAQTGTGKTLAFALPLLQQIARRKQGGLIILPTRELAIQVAETFEKVGQPFGLRHALLIGGAAMLHQLRALRRNPHVLIGTPGRINDHLERDQRLVANIGVLVLDEADRMFDMGFAPQINRILKHIPRNRQTLLFSATMPPEITKLAVQHMQQPTRVEVARSGTLAEKVSQELFIVQKDQKGQLLDKLLNTYTGTVLVFSRTKHGAKRICRSVRSIGHSAAEIHSNLSLSQRRKSLEGFKSGRYRILVATDIAARGIDVTNIEVVINYDLPESPEDYVHRVGRTGRAGKAGQAISFITPDQRGKIRHIERLVSLSLPISPLPELPAPRFQPKYSGPSSENFDRGKFYNRQRRPYRQRSHARSSSSRHSSRRARVHL